MSDVLVQLGHSGGRREVEGELLRDRLCIGGVLNNAQHPGLLRCIVILKMQHFLETQCLGGWTKCVPLKRQNAGLGEVHYCCGCHTDNRTKGMHDFNVLRL